MSEDTVRGIVIALLGTGGATFIWTVVKSIIAYRDSAEGREDKAIARLEKYEQDCRRDLAYEREWGAYWCRRATTLERLLIVSGIEVPAPPPMPKELPGNS